MLLAHKSGEKRISSFFTPLFNVIDMQQSKLFASRDSLANSREDKLFELTKAGDAVTLERYIKKYRKKLNLNCGVGADTPLVLAAKLGHISALKVLVKYGAKLDVPNERSLTPLIVAIINKQHDSIIEILKFEPDVNYCIDSDCSTPLHFAVTCNDPKIFISILNASNLKQLTLENKYRGTVLDTVLQLEESDGKKIILEALMNKIMFDMLLKILQMENLVKRFTNFNLAEADVLIEKASEYYFTIKYSKEDPNNCALISRAWKKTLAYYSSSKFARTKICQRYRN